jgi:ketosteroid isomerase-like protein
MSQENVEAVYRARDAFNRRDLQALADMTHEDFEFTSVLTAVDAGGSTYRGSASWATYFARMDDAWGDWQAEDFRAFDAGHDRIAAIFRLVGTGKSSGARVDRTIGLAYRLRDGKLWRMQSYLEPREALEAVGLPEQDAHADS